MSQRSDQKDSNPDFHLPPPSPRLARAVLFSFLITFLASRVMVLLIMTRRVPDLYLHLGGNHVHHLNYGIFILSLVGAWTVLWPPAWRRRKIAARLYGVGLALTFDEFGMWLHLGGDYWQRASWDAVAILAATLALIAYTPRVGRFKAKHWIGAGLIVLGIAVFSWLMIHVLFLAETHIGSRLHRIEQQAPQ